MSETMSEELAIEVRDVGKMYKIFPSPLSNGLHALGLGWMTRASRSGYREFWALKGVNLALPRGKRLGIIGCNGAGKTTLLKLLTGNFTATQGTVNVRGSVQALMTTGAGFHPEFTGRENIEASLTYQGLSPAQIREAIAEIADFTELESFFDQPFKTYSAGMQARVTFATATTITPDILIVDEVLGAGDGYFISKCTQRIDRLVKDSGATVLIVSHALDQVLRFCDEAIWLDRGRIVQSGQTLEVVKEYQQFLLAREERRLQAKNRRGSKDGGRSSNDHCLGTSVKLSVAVEGESGASGAACDVSEVTLYEDDQVYDRILVGGPQDSSLANSSYVSLEEACQWSSPKSEDEREYREVAVNGSQSRLATGDAVFNLWDLYPDKRYAVKLTYRCRSADLAAAQVWVNGEKRSETTLAIDGEWTELSMPIPSKAAPVTDEVESGRVTEPGAKRALRRWPSNGKLRIEKVQVLDAAGQEQVLFDVGQPMRIALQVQARQSGTYPVRPAVAFYCLDGILVSRHCPDIPFEIEMEDSQPTTLYLELSELNLGIGSYVFSAALFGRECSDADRYDLIDRAFEFQITAHEPKYRGTIFHHPSQWTLT